MTVDIAGMLSSRQTLRRLSPSARRRQISSAVSCVNREGRPRLRLFVADFIMAYVAGSTALLAVWGLTIAQFDRECPHQRQKALRRYTSWFTASRFMDLWIAL